MVVLDRENYIQKAENLLAQPAYRTIDRGPTNKLEAKFFLMLRRIKRETNMAILNMDIGYGLSLLELLLDAFGCLLQYG